MSSTQESYHHARQWWAFKRQVINRLWAASERGEPYERSLRGQMGYSDAGWAQAYADEVDLLHAEALEEDEGRGQ